MAHYFTPEYVIVLLLNQDDLLSYSKRMGAEDYMSTYMDASNDLEKIRSAFNKLSASHKQRIEVFLFSGKTQCEMAEILGTKQPNVKRNFIRSLKKLLGLLNGRP